MDKGHTHATDYYSSIKKNEIMPFVATWMVLEIIILNEATQRQISHAIIYMWNIKERYKINLFTKQKYTYKHRRQTF